MRVAAAVFLAGALRGLLVGPGAMAGAIDVARVGTVAGVGVAAGAEIDAGTWSVRRAVLLATLALPVALWVMAALLASVDEVAFLPAGRLAAGRLTKDSEASRLARFLGGGGRGIRTRGFAARKTEPITSSR